MVWHSGLFEENAQDLERIQKTALKIILQEEYSSFEKTPTILVVLETLEEGQETL